MLRSERWRAEWRWPQNVSWCCISYCLLSLFNELVCRITLKALCIFELCFLSTLTFRISWDREEITKLKKNLWLFLERMEAHYRERDWTLAAYAIHSGATRLIILLERLQVRVPQPALCNRHSNKSHRTQRWCYGLLLLSYLPVCQRVKRKERAWDEKRKSDSRQSLFTEVVDGEIFIETSVLAVVVCKCLDYAGADLMQCQIIRISKNVDFM